MSVAMLPRAPGRLSTTTGCPQRSDSFCPTVRARMSMPVPGVKGTMICTGLFGYALSPLIDGDCAHAPHASNPTPARPNIRFIDLSNDLIASSCAARGRSSTELCTSEMKLKHSRPGRALLRPHSFAPAQCFAVVSGDPFVAVGKRGKLLWADDVADP